MGRCLRAAFLFLLFISAPALGQVTTGTITGAVRDSTGGVLPGVTVTIKNAGTGTSRVVVTDAKGLYREANLSLGAYDVEAALTGFKTETRHIDLVAGPPAVVEFKLEVGGLSESVEVTAVTGSRLGTVPIGSTVTALGRDEITASGQPTLDRQIKEIPQVFDLGVSENSRGQSGGSGNITYGNSVNLRGIGPNATLVIVDGHRVVNNSRSTDPSILPTLGVERVEIVADGASGVYGSDAVAGVVNLIPRRNLDGIETFARGGLSSDTVYHESSVGVAAGRHFKRGQVMVAYEHVDRNNLNGVDRTFFRSNQTAFGGNDYSVTKCAPGTIRAAINGVTTNFAIPAGGASSAASLVAGTSNRCDDLQAQDLVPSQMYNSANTTFTYDLSKQVTFFMDGFFSRREFTRNPAYASATLTVPQTNAFFVRPDGFTGTSYSLDYNFSRDMVRNASRGHGQSWQLTPGIRLKLAHDWQFEALVAKGDTDDDSSSFLGVNNAALNAALASNNTATAFDPYGLYRTPSSVIAGIFDQVSINPTLGHFTGYEARVNGPVAKLPGGMMKAAAGYERQDFTADLGTARGGPTTPVTWTHPSRKVNSAYAELLVPVFGAGNATAGFHRLDLDLALRYDSYSDVGSTSNPKIGFSWAPVDRLTLRSSFGSSFRAPLLTQIYGNTNQLFVQNYQNPSGGAPIVGVAKSGPNPDLKPETAKTWSFGVDVDPAPGFRFSATFFSVDYKDQVIGLLSDLSVLTRASQYEGTGLITQGAAAGQAVAALFNSGLAVSGAFPGGNPLNVTVYVNGASFNLGRSVTRGIDFTPTYRVRTDAGTFTFAINGTYLTQFETNQTPSAPAIDQMNQIFQPLRFKSVQSVAWERGPFTMSVRQTFVNGYLNTAVTPNQSVDSYKPMDLTASWRLGAATTGFLLGFEARNLLGTMPPYVNIAPSSNGSGGYDATTTDPIGRRFAISIRKSLQFKH